MTNQTESQPDKLTISASKSSIRVWLALYLILIIGLPPLVWVAFGPGTPGDIATNGNSLLVFWIMRILFLGFWVLCLWALIRLCRLMRELPILFIFDKYGITDGDGNVTPWSDIDKAFYNGRGWSLHFFVRARSQYKNITIYLPHIGGASMDKAIAFVKEQIPNKYI